MKKIYLGIGMLGLGLLVSCDDKELTTGLPENQLITAINLDVTSELPMLVGTDSTIVYSVTPEDADIRELKWKSSNELVATVSDDGTISAMEVGDAVITVTPSVGFGRDENVKTISVSVLSRIIGAESIRFTNETYEVYETDQLQLTYDILPADHTYSYLTWSSSDESIATVDENGVVTGVKPGQVTITAYTHDKTGTTGSVDVTVKEVLPATDISITEPKPLYWKQSLELDYTLEPEDASIASVEWESSDESVLTVNRGVVQAVGFGTATVTATCKETGNSTSVELTVAPGFYVWDATTDFEGWAINSNFGSIERTDGVLKATTTPDADPKNKNKIYLQRAYNTQANVMDVNFKDYPVFAFRCSQLASGATYQINLANLEKTLNDSGGMTVVKQSDGTQVVYYDASKHSNLSDDGIVAIRAFMFKLTKIQEDAFTVYWIRTFESVDDMNNFVKADNVNQ